MVAIKNHQADAFIAARDRVPTAVLFYGGDVGLVAERAARLAKGLAERDDPQGEILRVDDASLETEPDRIAIELNTLPMFGGRKIVRALAGGQRGHVGSSMSLVEILRVLYDDILRYRPDELRWPGALSPTAERAQEAYQRTPVVAV